MPALRQPTRRVPFVIAVDGGAATGKTTICEALAAEFEIPYFNGGLIYRSFAYWCNQKGGPNLLQDDRWVSENLQSWSYSVSLESGRTHIYIDDTDVTDKLWAADVTDTVPITSRFASVRERFTQDQRAIVDRYKSIGGIVVDGRDATTAIAPDADLKLLLVAVPGSMTQSASERLDTDARNRADAKFVDFRTPREGTIVLETGSMSRDEAVAAALEAARGVKLGTQD